MKKSIIIMFAFILTAGFAYSQSVMDYKARNHKLNSHNKHVEANKKQAVVEASGDMTAAVTDYHERNSKFHNKTREHSHVIIKDEVNNDYRAQNHKLSKNSKKKQAEKPVSEDVLSRK